MEGEVWLYRPPTHKNSWRGKSRVIAIGPKAQAMIREYFTASLDDYLFSPAAAVAEIIAERASNRATPRYPSHMKRNAAKRKLNPRTAPGASYDRSAYALAVSRACDRAFPPPSPIAQSEDETFAEWRDRLSTEQLAQLRDWRKTHRWHPNRLRHLFATKVRKELGLEAAQVALGHARADVTQIYAERNLDLAATVALKVG